MSLQLRFNSALKALGVSSSAPAAIALSGGPDSLALAILVSKWLRGEHSVHQDSSKAVTWTAMVVNHGLRPEGHTEAATAVQQAEALGFQPVLLQAAWPDGHPGKGHVMDAARQTRYDLLETKCRELNISCLMTAHHADDQAESGLIRLVRASGIHGLQGMQASRPFFSAGLGESSGRVLRPLLAMRKDGLVALCRSQGLPFAMDATNKDTFFARNHLRRLMNSQQATAAYAPREPSNRSPSQAKVTDLACEHSAGGASKDRMDTAQGAKCRAAHKVDTGGHDPSRALTDDVLRVMAACSAASRKLQMAADQLLEQARLPGQFTLLDTETLRRHSKHVAVRALSNALMGLTHPGLDVRALSATPHKAAMQLWSALQPGRQPCAFSRGGCIECQVPGAPCPRLSAALVRWPEAGCAGQQCEPTRQALLLKPSVQTQ